MSGARALVVHALGIAGIAYETLVGQAQRPALLALFVCLAALPAFVATHSQAAAPRATARRTAELEHACGIAHTLDTATACQICR